jgi:hypothetical protein
MRPGSAEALSGRTPHLGRSEPAEHALPGRGRRGRAAAPRAQPHGLPQHRRRRGQHLLADLALDLALAWLLLPPALRPALAPALAALAGLAGLSRLPRRCHLPRLCGRRRRRGRPAPPAIDHLWEGRGVSD